jgi:iron complex outermembrane receptor protein
MNYPRTRISAAVSLLVGVMSSPLSLAQGQLEEIIVTATKTETSLQDTPIAVSAFSQDQLDSALINDTMNLQFNVPNMMMGKGNFTGSDIRIRGIGAGAVGSAGDNGVGVHVNGVYLNASRIFETQFYDTERVEVLRGPQGTLYGRNTTGGVVNVITGKANADELSGHIEATAGNYSNYQTRGHINVPLTDNLAMRASGMWMNRDGYVDNIYTGREIDDRDMWSGRLSLSWTGENTDANLMVHYFEEDDRRARSQKQACNKDPDAVLGCLPGKLSYGTSNTGAGISGFLLTSMGQVLAGSNQVMGETIPDATGDAFGNRALFANIPNYTWPVDDFANTVNPDDPRKVSMDFDPEYKADETIVSFEINHNIGDYRLTSLTGYSSSSVDSQEDYDKGVASSDWSPQMNALADLAETPALPAAFAALFVGTPAEPLIPYITDATTGIPGQGLWAGNPDIAALRDGVTYLTPNGDIGELHNTIVGIDQSKSTLDQWSQEFRVATEFDGDWNFLAGAFYLDYENENHYTVRNTGLSLPAQALQVSAIFPAPFGEPGSANSQTNPHQWGFDVDTRKYELETWALFGEAYWDITDQLTATAGIRYSDETKESKQRTIYITFLDNPTVDPDLGYIHPDYDSQETTGRFNITYNMSDEIMMYGNIATSYKSGGFNPISGDSELVDPAQGGDPGNLTFDPEYINSAEIGIKTTLFDGSMQLNGTLFYYDYEDLQTSKIVNVTSINVNTDATISGFEGEMLWAPTDNLRLTATFSWLDTDIDGFSTFDTADPNGMGTTEGVISCQGNNFLSDNPADCADTSQLSQGVPISQDGNNIQGSPEYSYNVGAAYTFDLSSAMYLTVSTNYYWQDEFYSRNFNAKADLVDEWEVWNASARLQSTDDTWYAEAWIKNINDDDFVTGSYLTSPVSSLFTNQFILDPQTYGGTVGYRW